MRGAIFGDIVGSGHEGRRTSESTRRDFALFTSTCGFTDDTVMTAAVMAALQAGVASMNEGMARKCYARTFHEYGNRYPHAGYGGFFRAWLSGDGSEARDSYGNGAMMRVSPVGWYFDDLATVERQAERTTLATHEHEESRRAAKAVATSILLARTKGLADRDAICGRVEGAYGYDLSRSYAALRAERSHDVTCMGTVPIVFAIFRECGGVEDAVRMAVCAGGDTDTNACIAGALAEAWYGMPEELWWRARGYLDASLRRQVDAFLAAVDRGGAGAGTGPGAGAG